MKGLKYKSEREEIYPGFDTFNNRSCRITFEEVAAKVINTEWRYSQYWTPKEWPKQALNDCERRIEIVLKDLTELRGVRDKLKEITEDMRLDEIEDEGE